ncbi:MAG: FHA domain-containing protein [Oscillospiraceae bacterium]|nr:FHA domain-containing protein [Oscillospiraceae bacterium]
MKKFKNIFALMIGLFIVISCFSISGNSVSAVGNISRYTVLVLDTTGQYTITSGFFNKIIVGSPLDKVKQAACVFVEKVLSADGDNYVALVTCAQNGEIAINFADDAQKLYGTIDGIPENDSESSTGFSNFNESLEKADELLSSVTDANAIKNILFFSGCLPAAGKYSETGHYSSADYDYIVGATGIKVYAHANVVYDTAEKMKNAGYNIYTLSCFTNLDQQKETFEFATQMMEDIQNKGYYNAEESDDLIDEIVSIADDIVYPFEVALSHKQVSVTRDIQDFGNGSTLYVNHYIFEITATITNGNNKIIENVTAKLELPNGMVLESGEEQQKINLIVSKGKVIATWVVKIPSVMDDKNLDYSVTVYSDYTLPVSAYGKIFVQGMVTRNNLLVFGQDTWNFENTGETVFLINSDKNTLLHAINAQPNTLKQKINDEIKNGNSGGICYGMSVTSVLYKGKRFYVDKIQNNNSAKNLYEVPKNTNSLSAILYHHLTWYLFKNSDSFNDELDKTIARKLTDIFLAAQKVEEGGMPFVIVYYWKTGCHAVVGYGFETGSFKQNNVTYNTRILIYDPNYPEYSNDACLYININNNTANGEWVIPYWGNCGSAYSGSAIQNGVYDLNEMDMVNMQSSEKSYRSYITAKNATDLIIRSKTNIWHINGTEIDEQDDITVSIFPKGNIDEIRYGIKKESVNKEELFSIESAERGKALNLSMEYNNYLMTADSLSDGIITFNPAGSVQIFGNSQKFNLSFTANEGYYSLPWYTVKVSGDKAESPELIFTPDGCILNAKDMVNIHVMGQNDSEIKEVDFNTDKNSVFIGSYNGELAVYSDENDDGKYEKLIAISGGNDPEPPNPTSPTTTPILPPNIPSDADWTIVPIAIGAFFLVIMMVVLVVFASSRNSGRQNEKTEIDIPIRRNEPNPKIPSSNERIGKGITEPLANASMTILAGSMKGATIPINGGNAVTLGKDPNRCQLVFSRDYAHVSRLHCVVAFDSMSNQYFVTDYSSNGTYFENRNPLPKGNRTPVKRGVTLLLANEDCKIKLN